MRVTLLFTDIEGSTALLGKFPRAYSEALTRHHSILRSAAAEHHGREFHEAGDAFCFAFDKPCQGIACAVAIQRALAQERWPESIVMKVRAALHTSEAEFRDGQYRGMAMNRAARILSAAHGGQIICCAETAECIDGELRARELGKYRLRDIPEPMELFQIHYHGMPVEKFPLLKAEPAARQNLPVLLTRIFGREEETAQLSALLGRDSPERLITLTGPGGTGKTRLSISAAHELLESYSHAITFVALADVTDPRLLPEVTADALKIERDPSRSTLDQIADTIANHCRLLLFDNFEQIATEGGEFLLMLLRRAPQLRVLVTSRQKLAIPGEREFLVRPLPVPPVAQGFDQSAQNASVHLFVDRARAVNGGFDLTPRNFADVTAICRMLEGIPLAIELAAARAQILAPREIFEQIEHHVTTLADESGDRPERHRSLHAAIDWSYNALPSDVQTFFSRMSVFRGGWNAEAAAAIADVTLTVALNLLLQLRTSSLLIAEENNERMRYRMLETIRQYAAERLGSDTEATRKKHFEFFSGLAKKAEPALAGVDHTQSVARLETEHDNLRVALAAAPSLQGRLELAQTLRNFWNTRGYFSEALHWLTFDDSDAATVSVEKLPFILNTRAGFYRGVGEIANAQRDFEDALRLFKAQNHKRNAAVVLANLGSIAGMKGELNLARRYQDETLAIFREIGDAQLPAALNNAANTALQQRDFDAARKYLDEALAITRDKNDARLMAALLQNFAAMELFKGKLNSALQQCVESLRIRIEGNYPPISPIYRLAAEILLELDEAEIAAGILSAADVADEQLHVQLAAADAADAQKHFRNAKKKLGEAKFLKAWENGRMLVPELIFEQLTRVAQKNVFT